MENTSFDAVAPMLDEMHEGGLADRNCRTGQSDDNTSDDRPDRADGERNARSGGAIYVHAPKRGRVMGGASEVTVPHQKRLRTAESATTSAASSVAAPGAEPLQHQSQTDHLRGECVSSGTTACDAKHKKKIRTSGRRKAPAVEAQPRENGSSAILPTTKRPSPLETHVIEPTGSGQVVAHNDANSDVNTDHPVTRSSRVSKPPTWFGDNIYIMYKNPNPKDSVSAASGE